MRWCYTNYADDSTIYNFTSEEALYPVVNVQDVNPQKVFRSVLTDTTINVDFYSSVAYAPTCIILHKTNISASATVTFKSSSDSSFGTVNGENATMTAIGNGDYILFSSAAAKNYYRINVVDGSNPDGYIEIGHIYIGTNYQYINTDASFNISYVNNDNVTFGSNGSIFSSAGSRYRVFNFTFYQKGSYLMDAEKLWSSVGNYKPFYLIVYYSSYSLFVPYYVCLQGDTNAKYFQKKVDFTMSFREVC